MRGTGPIPADLKRCPYGESWRTRFKKEYIAWNNMRQRCDNKNYSQYKDYGGRGITYDPRWAAFPAFLADVGACPHPKLTLERNNVNLGYTKENCRWATRFEQAQNKRVMAKTVGVYFQTRRQKWCARGREDNIWFVLYWGDSEEDAIAARKCWEKTQCVA